MAKSKLVEANQKIAEGATSGFQKMSNRVVNEYTKIEDQFVDHYLRKDKETIIEAKERLEDEQNTRNETHARHHE